MAGQPRPADGQFVGFARILLRYPEILGWEREYRLGREAIGEAMYRRVKSVKPSAEVGWHVDHQPSSWDLVYRAEMSYADMAPYADFVKSSSTTTFWGRESAGGIWIVCKEAY
jgi:hypothetical protein